MNNRKLTSANQASQQKAQSRSQIADDRELLNLSNQNPYFGYVDIIVGNVDPFLMFSNNDDFVARKFFWNGANAYEPTSLRLWSALSGHSPTVLDVGAYTGIYALTSAMTNPKTRVFAFEALERAYNRLQINKSVNRCINLAPVHAAVSDCAGVAEFNVYTGSDILTTGSSMLPKNVGREIFEKCQVKTLALDDFFADHDSRVGLIKIDVEGAEDLVIQGSAKIIKKYYPDILIELLKGADIDAVEKIIHGLGYKFYQINDAEHTIQQIPHLQTATGMHNLNTLITTKDLGQIQGLLA